MLHQTARHAADFRDLRRREMFRIEWSYFGHKGIVFPEALRSKNHFPFLPFFPLGKIAFESDDRLGVLHLANGRGLDLPDPLLRHPHFPADVLQRPLLLAE